MNNNVQVDLVTPNGAQGELGNYMLAQGGRLDPGKMRPYIASDGQAYITMYKGGDPKSPASYAAMPIQVNNATLRRDEWKQLDDVLLRVAESRLGGIEDLKANGLVFNLGNAMGTTVLEWHDVSDAMEAVLSMDGVNRSQGDRPVYTTNYLPLPIAHSDYEINARVLAASRTMGQALDTTSVERAGRKVLQTIENMLFTNTTYGFGGGTIYSYINHPDRNLATLGTSWLSQSTPKTIVDAVIAMKQTAIDNYYYGPYALYIPGKYETVMDKDYETTSGKGTTIRERLMKIEGIKSVKAIDTLPLDNVVLVQLTQDVVRLVNGMGLQNVEWQTEGKMVTKYKVMTIQVPQIRSDQNGKCGIVHAS